MNLYRFLKIAGLIALLSSCGGGGSDSPTGSDGNTPVVDLTPPSGYQLQSLDPVSSSNASNYAFSVTGMELGASYFYSIFDSSSSSALISYSARALGTTDSFTENLAAFQDGEIRIEFHMTDTEGNEGSIISLSTVKDVLVPSGYSISSATTEVDSFNVSDFSFSVTDAEVGTRYEYEIFDSTSSTIPQLSGSGDVLTSSFEIDGIDLSSLQDGSIQLDFRLDDGVNTGLPSSLNLTKNTSVLLDPVMISGTITYDDIPHFCLLYTSDAADD